MLTAKTFKKTFLKFGKVEIKHFYDYLLGRYIQNLLSYIFIQHTKDASHTDWRWEVAPTLVSCICKNCRYGEAWHISIPCPDSDRCDTAGVPLPPLRRSAPAISRVCPVLGWRTMLQLLARRAAESNAFSVPDRNALCGSGQRMTSLYKL